MNQKNVQNLTLFQKLLLKYGISSHNNKYLIKYFINNIINRNIEKKWLTSYQKWDIEGR